MKLNANALGMSSGIFCGAWCLIIALLNIWFGYAQSYMSVIASLEPGVVVGTYGGAVVTLIYGLVAGYVSGYVFAWLYNQFVKK